VTKFLMTGLPRSGTTVVSGSIITHPQVLFYGELLNQFIGVRQTEAARTTLGGRWEIANTPRREFRACGLEENGSQYLQELYSLDNDSKAIGFKLLFHQARNGPNSHVWSYLADNTDIKIISTRRENLLDVVCSWVKANRSNVWHISGDEKPGEKVELSVQRCEELINHFSQMQKILGLIQNQHQVLEIDYQLINDDFGGAMNTVYDFLELDSMEAKPSLKKIARHTPREEITNYDQLKEYFSNTQYAEYFSY
jgi:hypothetical protein